jgi:hypothetical protein
MLRSLRENEEGRLLVQAFPPFFNLSSETYDECIAERCEVCNSGTKFLPMRRLHSALLIQYFTDCVCGLLAVVVKRNKFHLFW